MPNGRGRQQRKASKFSEKWHRRVNILHKTEKPNLESPEDTSFTKVMRNVLVRSSAVVGHCRTGLRVEMLLQGALGSLIAMRMIGW